jgi:hypothetical protein
MKSDFSDIQKRKTFKVHRTRIGQGLEIERASQGQEYLGRAKTMTTLKISFSLCMLPCHLSKKKIKQ